MTPVFVPRSAIGLGTPTSTSGTPRPLLAPALPTHTVHYAGIDVEDMFYADDRGYFDSLAAAMSYVRRVEEIARASGKPFEYNTMIPSFTNPEWSYVLQYADEYVAAHSAGNNATSHGTQLALGVGQVPTIGAVRAFQWWNDLLTAAGRLSPIHRVVPHLEMPGASTACPGPVVIALLPALRSPYQPPEVPAMAAVTGPVIYKPTFSTPAGYDPCWWFVSDTGAVRRAVGPDLSRDLPVLDLDSPEHYDELHRESGTSYPARPR